MKTVLVKEKTKTSVASKSTLVLEKVRSGIPLYEIAGDLGISTATASEMMDHELLRERKKIETQQKRGVIDLFEQSFSAEKIAVELSLPLSFVHKTIIQNSNKLNRIEKVEVYKKEKYSEENPDDKTNLTHVEKEHRDHDVMDAYKNGETISAIAQRLFLKNGMVYFILRKNGMEKLNHKAESKVAA